jgi:dihydrofolate reductase
MKIIMVAATSLDGFIADDQSNVTSWTSDADKKFFNDIKSKHDLYVMGSKTYSASPKKLDPAVLRVVLTRSPDTYASASVPGQLEFHNLSPSEFVKKYRQHEACLLLGGGHIYEAFLEANLVDEIYLTVEPLWHEKGTSLLASNKKLEEVVDIPAAVETKINDRGTKLLHYMLNN